MTTRRARSPVGPAYIVLPRRWRRSWQVCATSSKQQWRPLMRSVKAALAGRAGDYGGSRRRGNGALAPYRVEANSVPGSVGARQRAGTQPQDTTCAATGRWLVLLVLGVAGLS